MVGRYTNVQDWLVQRNPGQLHDHRRAAQRIRHVFPQDSGLLGNLLYVRIAGREEIVKTAILDYVADVVLEVFDGLGVVDILVQMISIGLYYRKARCMRTVPGAGLDPEGVGFAWLLADLMAF